MPNDDEGQTKWGLVTAAAYENTVNYLCSGDWLAHLMGLLPDDRTDEEKRAYREEQRRKRAEEAAAELRDHEALMEVADARDREVLVLHGPHRYEHSDWYAHCKGCDAGSYAEDSPGFPCRTYELVAGWYA